MVVIVGRERSRIGKSDAIPSNFIHHCHSHYTSETAAMNTQLHSVSAPTVTEPAPSAGAEGVSDADGCVGVGVDVGDAAPGSAVSSPPSPVREGGVPVAISSVVAVLCDNTSVRINTYDVCVVGFDELLLLMLLPLLLLPSLTALAIGRFSDAGSIAVGVERRADVTTETVEAVVGVAPGTADVGVGITSLPLGAEFQGPRRHCFMSGVSTRRLSCFDGVRLRM